MNSNPSTTRFLLIQTAFIGDVILATPLIEKLKGIYPHAIIDLFLRKGNEELFREHPYISNLYIWDKKNAKYGQLFSLIHRIRKQRYDVCINLQRHGTTGLVTILSGAAETIGFTMNPFSCFFTRSFVHRIGHAPGLTHETDLYLQLLTGIVPDLSRIPPRLYPHISSITGKNIHKPYVTIAPASIWFTKQYPFDNWVKVIDLIDKKTTVYLIGAANDYDLCDVIVGMTSHPNVRNIAGSLSLLESAALMKDAEMNYVNDSAPLHIASAVDAPVTAVFCSTVTGFGYGPSGTRGRVVETAHPLKCRPCGPHGHKRCPEGHFRCADIPPEKVVFQK